MAKAAEVIADLKGTVDKLESGRQSLSTGLKNARGKLSELTQDLNEASAELQKLREEPFVDAAVGVAMAVGGGAAAGAIDWAIGPVYNLGGEATVEADGSTTYKGGVQVMPSLLAGAGLTILGVAEKNKTVLETGRNMLAAYTYGQTQRTLDNMFTS